MAVPDFQSLTLPVLKEFADGLDHATKDIRLRVAERLQLSEADISEVLPSGTQTRFANRIAWAHVYMKRAGLLSSSQRGIYHITDRGREVLKSPPPRVDIEFLSQFPELATLRSPTLGSTQPKSSDAGVVSAAIAGLSAAADGPALTPDEQIQLGAAQINENLVAQLLERMKKGSAAAFEQLVVDVLVAMGYGGAQADATEIVGKSGDGGIDGIIKEDRLGLEAIYVQAKRWEGTVGRPVIQQFAGALQGHHARKGVVITTSKFSADAKDYAGSCPNKIVLIDGTQLANYMIEFGVGVSDMKTIKIKRLDEGYFSEE